MLKFTSAEVGVFVGKAGIAHKKQRNLRKVRIGRLKRMACEGKGKSFLHLLFVIGRQRKNRSEKLRILSTMLG